MVVAPLAKAVEAVAAASSTASRRTTASFAMPVDCIGDGFVARRQRASIGVLSPMLSVYELCVV
jgi:hypothetical protein